MAQPIATFVHELGHAGVPLAATKEPVAIRIGRLPSLRQTRIGRLQLMLHWYPAYPYGLTGYKGRLNRRTRIMFVLGGPTAHAAFGALLTAIGLSGHLSVLTGVGVVVFCEAFSNLIPFTRHGFRSDGSPTLARSSRQVQPPDDARSSRKTQALNHAHFCYCCDNGSAPAASL